MRSLLACLCLLFVTAAAAAGHDFDGDSRSDVLWRHTDGTNYVWHVDGAVINGGVLSIPSQGGAMQLTRRIQRVIEFFASAMLAVSFPVMLSAEPLTTEQGDAILNELRAIRGLLERQQQRPPAPAAMPENNEPVKANVKGAQALGRADAPVTIVAFIDYQCPFCKRFDTDTLPELKKRYIDSGKVRYVIRDLPLERIHPRAHKAAEATYCAADQANSGR